MTANTQAATKARATRAAPLPQESSETTTCDDCDERPAAGVNVDGRSLCRPCAQRVGTLVCDGGEDEDSEGLIPYPARSYEGRDARDLRPARVDTYDTSFHADHVEEREHTLHLVNYDEQGDVEECVSFPYHVVEHIVWYPAEEAREASPYDGCDPLAARAETEADVDE